MKKQVSIFLFLLTFLLFGATSLKPIFAQAIPTPTPLYEPCLGSWCPLITGINYTCAASYNDWVRNKSQNLWVSDPEVTALGKAGERSRQFLYWTLTHRSVDDHPVLLSIWTFTKNMVYFFLLIVAAIFGLGIIIGQRVNFKLKIEVWPLFIKILLLFLYVTFSASIILLIVQLSDTLMLFFIERLGVKNLFNIFFLSSQGGSVISDSETAYLTFKGCTNVNIELLDSVKTSKFMVHFTNMTYYMIGIMFILRKVLLWLLLFVSPFLALLMPFVFIRNAGWIWIGVFFQWVFYGPLFGLFLGGLASIWGSPSHIPYNFDFSRTNKMEGFIYPTTINILYGGPAQKLELLNSANYTDTFAEYIIALIMLWAVTFFPWWLLRIFRDYCCEGILAMKNILLSMYDQMRGGPPPSAPGPVPVPAPAGLTTGTALKLPKEETVPTVTRLETIEDIKKTRTEDITRSLQFSVSHLTDIARFETNKQHQETVNKNINFLQNPMKAETPTERQKYMNIRSELFNRAIKEDKTAKQILSSISTSKIEQVQRREEILRTTPQSIPVTHIISVKVKIPTEKVQSVTSSFVQSVSQNTTMLQSLSQLTQIPQTKVQSVLNAYTQNISQPASKIVQSIATQTGLTKEKVSSIIQNTTNVIRQSQLIDKIAVKEQVAIDHVEKILSSVSSSLIREVGIPTEKVTSITKSMLTSVSNDQTFVKQLEKQTNLPTNQINNILNVYSQNLNQPLENTINNISTQTGVQKEKVKEVINTILATIPSTKEKETFASRISTQVGIPVEKVISITKSILSSVSSDHTFVNQLEKQTNLPTKQISQILNIFTQNVNQPMTTTVSNIANQTGVEKEKVKQVINTTVNNLKTSRDTIKQIIQKENVKESDLQKIVENQIPIVAQPEKYIEQTISIPPSVSLDEYEQVKKMWRDQYERGEVPVSDKIKSRDQWVEQDVVFITNNLNKLVSDSPEIKQEGLDELGYILPIFLINNLKGDQLLVYLKAKLEAAKEVQTLKEKETEVEAKFKEAEKVEEFVEVEKPKVEEKEKVMEMKQELEEKEIEDKHAGEKEPEEAEEKKEEEPVDIEKPKGQEEEKVMEPKEDNENKDKNK